MKRCVSWALNISPRVDDLIAYHWGSILTKKSNKKQTRRFVLTLMKHWSSKMSSLTSMLITRRNTIEIILLVSLEYTRS